MRRTIIAIGIILSLFIGTLFIAGPVRADEHLSAEQLAKIKSNCTTIKASMTQLQVSDTLLRVNRGQLYLALANNFMDNFNNRLSSNSLDNRAMTTVTVSYRAAFSKFSTDYSVYKRKISDALSIDCKQDPQGFHDTVLAARELRFTVHEDIQKLHRSIDDYRISVGDFLLTFERISR